MVEILEQPAIRRQVSPMPVDVYHRLGEFDPHGKRTELIRGIVIDKMSKSPLHVLLLYRLLALVQAAAAIGGLFVRKEDPLTLSDSEPEPDIAVVAGEAADYHLQHPATALLAIELSITSLELDRAKAFLYAEANVPEYWIVLARKEAVEVYTEPVAGVYQRCQTYGRDETIACGVLPGLRVEVEALFAE